MTEAAFPNFHGNAPAQQTLLKMMASERIPQTILFDGPEGIGKATLARRFAAQLLGGGADKIENDDLSLPHNATVILEREKLTSDKRADDPLMFGSHPDFLTFCTDGPLAQISIQQMRLLKDRAQFGPSSGQRRVFLIDGIDRANEQAANSLLKTLEEPPPYLVIVMTAQNSYDLLPTIRSRSVPIRLGRLGEDEMKAFAREKGIANAERRIALAAGSPGVALSVDLEQYDKRRQSMRALLEAASGASGFAVWAAESEKLSAARSEKLEPYLKVLYLLLEDLVHLREGVTSIRNPDLREPLTKLAGRVSHEWIRRAVTKTDELIRMLRRNIQKNIALDAMVIELRGE
jgi:DNA polymerase-3 subunit delta'